MLQASGLCSPECSLFERFAPSCGDDPQDSIISDRSCGEGNSRNDANAHTDDRNCIRLNVSRSQPNGRRLGRFSIASGATGSYIVELQFIADPENDTQMKARERVAHD